MASRAGRARPGATISCRYRAVFSLAAVRDSKGLTQSGEIRMECSAEGRSGSYAVLVTGPEDARMWVLFAGLTGDAALLASGVAG